MLAIVVIVLVVCL